MPKVKSIVKEPEEETKELPPLFEHFKWHRDEVEKVKLPGRAEMNFAGDVIDVTNGVNAILKLRAFDALQDEDESERRLLNDAQHLELERLCIASLGMLNDLATRHIDWAYERHTPEGIAEREGDNG